MSFCPAEFLPSELFVRRIASEENEINFWPGQDAALQALQKRSRKRRAAVVGQRSQTQAKQARGREEPRGGAHLGAPADIGDQRPDDEEAEDDMFVFEDKDDLFGDPAVSDSEEHSWLEDLDELLATQAELDAALAPADSDHDEDVIEVWEPGMPSSSSAVAPPTPLAAPSSSSSSSSSCSCATCSPCTRACAFSGGTFSTFAA